MFAAGPKGLDDASKLDGAHRSAWQQWRKEEVVARTDQSHIEVSVRESLSEPVAGESSSRDQDIFFHG